jgi:acetylornithine deacetylase/succinyl-diaminopimelate desuccinylase-like protein
MSDWDPLLDRLAEAPRENGSLALHETAQWLVGALQAAGVSDVEWIEFVAHPHALRMAGLVVLAVLLLYAWLLRRGRPLAAALLLLAGAAAILADLDYEVPVFSAIGAEVQPHVVGRIAAAGEPVARLLLVAHFDTKTDLFDHVERAPVDVASLPVVAFLLVAAFGAAAAPRAGRFAAALRAGARVATWLAPIYGAFAFLVFTGGVFVRARSPGAIDDGAACAVLLRVAEALAAAPPARTEVEIALLSAEEVGVQGSHVFAARRFAKPPALPTFVLNFDPIGVAPGLRLLRRESFTMRSFAPDPRLVARLDEVYEAERGEKLSRTPFSGGTDARSFLAHGIPAATLITESPGSVFVRDLHSVRDERSRLDEAALDATLAFVLRFVRSVDERPL